MRNSWTTCAVLPLFLLCVAACAEPTISSAPPSFSTRVVRVADGDTVAVTLEREMIRIRLWGIDCPERDQPWGQEATDRASAALLGKHAEFIWHDTDRYGRRVCEIILPDGENFNATLVREGLAWWYRHFAPNANHLRDAQREAMAARRGIWADPGPVAPWDWRRRDPEQPALPERELPGEAPGVVDAEPHGDEAARQEIEVFVTDSGARFHRDGCRHLVSRHALPLRAAQALGYEACRVCEPGE